MAIFMADALFDTYSLL